MSTTRQNETPAFAQTITRLRLQANLSQAELARRAKTSRSYVLELERGRSAKKKKLIEPRVDTLRRIADALATDGLTKEINHEQANQYYQQLAEAAGYLPNANPAPALPAARRRAVAKQQIYTLLREYPELEVAFDAIPDDVGPEDVEMVRQMIVMLVNQIRQRRGLAPVPLGI